MKTTMLLTGVVMAGLLFAGSAGAVFEKGLSEGQTVYVPVYSNIFVSSRGTPFSLDVTLIVRNTSTTESLTFLAADYYDTGGTLTRRFLDAPVLLRPLETKHIYLPGGGEGGLGANFVVRWSADREMSPPIIECLMIGTRSGQGISFLSLGKVIL